MSTEGFRLVTPPGLVAHAARIAELSLERRMAVPGRPSPLVGQWTNFCAAQGVDDRSQLARGFVPAGRLRLRANGVNAARIMSWSKVDLATGAAETYAFDIDPESGGVLSVRYSTATLEMLTEMDPRLDGWLLTAAGGGGDA
jgi:hypothetical protein